VLTDLPPNSGTSVRVQITGTDEARAARWCWGSCATSARRRSGPRAGSPIIREEHRRLRQRLAGRARLRQALVLQPLIDKNQVDPLFRILALYRATPIIWIGAEEYRSTIIYGWARDWAVEIAYPKHSLLSLEIEGLI
jgi:hypothetical protein